LNVYYYLQFLLNKMNSISAPTPYNLKKQLAAASAAAAAAAAIPLTKKGDESVMRIIERSKLKEHKYIECVVDGKNGDKVTVWPPPCSPPWTTWSGLMLCKPESPYAKRLAEKCGGILVTEDGKEFVGKGTAAAVMGFWTAPEDWQGMLVEMSDLKSWTPPDNWHETLIKMRNAEEEKIKKTG
jgi:hypothetical protein